MFTPETGNRVTGSEDDVLREYRVLLKIAIPLYDRIERVQNATHETNVTSLKHPKRSSFEKKTRSNRWEERSKGERKF